MIIRIKSFPFLSAGFAVSVLALIPAGLYTFSTPFQQKADALHQKHIRLPVLYRFVLMLILMFHFTFIREAAADLGQWVLLPPNVMMDLLIFGSMNK